MMDVVAVPAVVPGGAAATTRRPTEGEMAEMRGVRSRSRLDELIEGVESIDHTGLIAAASMHTHSCCGRPRRQRTTWRAGTSRASSCKNPHPLGSHRDMGVRRFEGLGFKTCWIEGRVRKRAWNNRS